MNEKSEVKETATDGPNWLPRFVRRLVERTPKPEPKTLWWEDRWKEVRDQYPVGRSFEYLGRNLLVAQYKWADDAMTCIQYGVHPMPEMVCEYADNEGILREWVFNPRMFKVLLANVEWRYK